MLPLGLATAETVYCRGPSEPPQAVSAPQTTSRSRLEATGRVREGARRAWLTMSLA